MNTHCDNSRRILASSMDMSQSNFVMNTMPTEQGLDKNAYSDIFNDNNSSHCRDSPELTILKVNKVRSFN